MKKLLFLLLILSILIPFNGKSQVAKIKNELISDDEIILIGPLNVDTYFPEQSNIYISKYEKVVKELESLIDPFYSELWYLENKKVTNKFKINQIIKAIDKINLELELLNEFILLWEEHNLKFSSYHNFLKENSNGINCYSLIIGGDTLKNTEVEVIEVKPQKQIEYFEFIEGDYVEILKLYSRQKYDKKIHSSKCIIKIEGQPREFLVCDAGYVLKTSNILEQIEKKRNFHGRIDGKIQWKILEIDDPKILRRIEYLFPAFRFDKYDIEFSRKRKFKEVRAFFQISLNEESPQIVPDKVFITGCD